MTQLLKYFERAMRFLPWGLMIVIVIASLSPIEMRPRSGFSVRFEHLVVFALTSFMFAVGYSWRLVRLLAFLIAFAALLEWAQTFVPGRHARLSDFAVKAFGVAVGLIVGYLVRMKMPYWGDSKRAK